MMFSRLLRSCLLVTVAASASYAGNFSFTGTFSSDDQVQLFNFSLASATTVTFQSWGFGGTGAGANSAGATIASAGFDSYLTWFAGDGTQIGTNDDGCGSGNPYNSSCSDAFFSGNLDAGNYILALTVSGNSPMGNLSDGFTQQGAGNFTCPQGFCDLLGNQLDGHWAVDILTVDSAAVSDAPEPANFLLVPGALALLGLARRRLS